jgi:hypothetical protein
VHGGYRWHDCPGHAGPDANSGVDPGRGGGSRTYSQSAHGSNADPGSDASNLTWVALDGDITRAGGAALGSRGNFLGTNSCMPIVSTGTVNDGVNLFAGGSDGTLGASGGGIVRPSSGDVLGGISVGDGVGLEIGALGSSRGGLDTSDDGILHDTLSARSGSGNRSSGDRL